jgi:hypothetical protein
MGTSLARRTCSALEVALAGNLASLVWIGGDGAGQELDGTAVLLVTERRGQREESVEDEEIRLVACMWAPHGTGVTCRSRRTGSRGSPG